MSLLDTISCKVLEMSQGLIGQTVKVTVVYSSLCNYTGTIVGIDSAGFRVRIWLDGQYSIYAFQYTELSLNC